MCVCEGVVNDSTKNCSPHTMMQIIEGEPLLTLMLNTES